MVNIDIAEIFEDSLQIFVWYTIILVVLIYLLLVSKKITAIFNRLNSIRISKVDKKFKLNYVAILVLISIVIASLFIIGVKQFRGVNFSFFFVFSMFAFLILPIALGLLGVYAYILKNGEYRLGSVLLLAISFASLGMVGSNLHDVLWCGVATNWYQTKRLAGYDLEMWFNIFGIYDKNQYDYRTFGLFMVYQVAIELVVATLVLYKFYKTTNEYKKIEKKKPIVLTWICLIAISVFFGTVEFIFDYPWAFTELQYAIDVYIGIPIVAVLFYLIGFKLGRNLKV